jgi:hypothetical protein
MSLFLGRSRTAGSHPPAKGVHRSMNTLPTRFVCRHIRLCFTVLGALALGCGAGNCRGDEMAAEVAKPLQEFKARQHEIEQEATNKTERELETLRRKLENIKKGKNKKANEQAAQLLDEINAPTFLAVGLDLLMAKAQVGVTLQGAWAIANAYKKRLVTAEDWAKFPGDVIVAPEKGVNAGIDVKAGDFVLMCPHPTQKFREGKKHPWVTFDARGGAPRHYLAARITNDTDTKTLALKDNVLWECPLDGRLSFETGWGHSGEGSIECKVFKVVAQKVVAK